ncbi:MotA/TolQ/ExbB proton channel family protein [Capnocytophaga cynodegmi]|uniref:Transporter, MotA/TolQ/ExbB proton channel family protein n=1 Tax=Capnocytophaga cynodegmi TaxID=28189 RepID=A0A0B7HG31_9FLAO|nr:MotA/TolQ/ExbB proton channel family protein [Capnocytophaga cynodegmi]GIM51468.1 membrane protein [Capnocytophaga cynodegmi]CEN35967.1 Transporter, MotA/TolQ/ExbB proton channel family protein [Capnocytophaga cynodegmi]CEN36528.1 Transporter, MotA/TolQ/ExbB proton channel family protein [Capnocytophaga cynodegmi]
MEIISKILFWVSNSLLIPDIIALLYLFIKSLLMVGSFYNRFINRQKNDKLLSEAIKTSTPDTIENIKKLLPDTDNSLYIRYLRDMLSHKPDAAYTDFLITNFEIDADKDITSSKILAKVGPILGLIGTLIAMSPALVGLSSGDISSMAYNMQIVFATTVVGLVISIVGVVTQQIKQRWYTQESNNLYYISQIRNQNITQ